MSLRRVGWSAAILVAELILMSCGEVYRPVVIPIPNNPPNPANQHAVFGISTNVAPNPGTVLQIDVAGDSNVGVARMGINPHPTTGCTHIEGCLSSLFFFVSGGGGV